MDREERNDENSGSRAGVGYGSGIPPVRLAIGVGDPEREQALLPALSGFDDIVIMERCLTGDQLLDCIQRGTVDVALVAFDLHRLHQDVLSEVALSNMPVVLLVPEASDERWQEYQCIVLPITADPESIRQAVVAAVRGERLLIARPTGKLDTAPAVTDLPAPSSGPTSDFAVITLASGHGSPGRTTTAVNLAAALGMVAPTILVDADLVGPSIAAHLDADPTRNLAMLAYAEPVTSGEWERAVAQESQPLSPDVPSADVLCGIPKPAMRSRISAQFFEQLIAQLQRLYRHVVLDIGADFQGPNEVVHRQALGFAQQILFMASSDIPGLWHARVGLDSLHSHVRIDADRVALIINRHDRRYHHSRGEIEWALGIASAAVIPYDHQSVQRALCAQRPLVLDRRSRPGRALLDLAGRIQDESLAASPEHPKREHVHSRRSQLALQRSWLSRRGIPKATD
jgi:Flp pilus assembly CpaE family ATPase